MKRQQVINEQTVLRTAIQAFAAATGASVKVLLQMLEAFGKVVNQLGIDFFLLGALARDIRLFNDSKLAAKRITKDVDIADQSWFENICRTGYQTAFAHDHLYQRDSGKRIAAKPV